MHKYPQLWKCLAAGIILLFVTTGIIPSTAQDNEKPLETSGGNWLYVGGGGPGNYTTIQSAIDNASDGDTVFVFNGTYHEHVFIDKTIQLIGANKNFVIIDGNKIGDVVSIVSDNVYLSGFTIQNSGDDDFDAGIEIRSDNNTIVGNVIHDNGGNDYQDQGGIYLNFSSYNDISYNSIYENEQDGIFLIGSNYNHIHNNSIYHNSFIAMIISYSSHNRIEYNDMYENYCCLSFWPYSTNNVIMYNYIHDHPGCGMAFKAYSNCNIIRYNNLSNNKEWGIMLGPGPTERNVIEFNTISKTTGPGYWYGSSGLVLQYAYFNTIKYNNIMENRIDVYLNTSLGNIWSDNYWDNYSGFGPKIIVGTLSMPWNPSWGMPWINVDWRPASKPYDAPHMC